MRMAARRECSTHTRGSEIPGRAHQRPRRGRAKARRRMLGPQGGCEAGEQCRVFGPIRRRQFYTGLHVDANRVKALHKGRHVVGIEPAGEDDPPSPRRLHHLCHVGASPGDCRSRLTAALARFYS